jgi:Carboxypeptidase regulatory-like domain
MLRMQRLLVVCLFGVGVAQATVFGTVRGGAHDPSHRPIAGAEMTLSARDSAYQQNRRIDAMVEFEFLAVPVGEYTVRVLYVGFAAAEQIVIVVSGHAPVLHVQLRLAAQRTSVEVSETQDAVARCLRPRNHW